MLAHHLQLFLSYFVHPHFLPPRPLPHFLPSLPPSFIASFLPFYKGVVFLYVVVDLFRWVKRLTDI